MKYLILVLVCLLNLNVFANTGDVEEAIKELKSKYVPDRRVGVWDIEIQEENDEYTISGKVDNALYKAEIEKTLKDLGIKYTTAIKVLPDESLENTWGLVSISVACIRTHPKSGAELASQAIMGTPMKILEIVDGMARVQTPDNYIGYMTTSSFAYKTDKEFADWKESKRYIVSVYQGTLWEDKKEKMPVTDVVMGNLLEFVEKDGDYLLLALPDGRKGYAHKSIVTEFKKWTKQSFDFDRMQKLGFRMLGTPYLWGGMSTKTLDCSGFVRTLYFHNGIIMQRDASQQALKGGIVDWKNWREEAQPGDLIFIGTKSGKVTHVAMYMGGGKYIHSSGRVKINSMDENAEDYLDYTFLGMRRINGYVNTDGITAVKDHSWYLNSNQ